MLKAARLGDEISHTRQRSGLLGGMLLGAALVGVALLTVATGGTALFVIGALAMGAAVGGGLGRWWGSGQLVTKGKINKAATTVFINSRGTPAARACTDTALCDDHTLKLIATGSTTVAIEGFPAARLTDVGECSFKISQGSDNVFIGGETAQCAGLEITPEVEPWLENLHLALGLVGSFCLGYGALGWAGSALSTAMGFGGSLLGSEIGGRYGRGWGIAGGILGGILGGGFGIGISRGLGRAGIRGFQPIVPARSLSYVPSSGQRIAANPNRTSTILGRWNPDMQQIKPLMGADDFNVGTEFGRVGQNRGGYNFLDVPDDVFRASGDNFFEAYNKPWLNQAMTRGDDVLLATKPTSRFDIMTPDGALKGNYARELEHLVNNNYKPANVTASEWQTISSWFGK